VKYLISFIIFIIIILNMTAVVFAKQPKAKFYDFRDQIIDGEVRRPTTLYTDARQKVKFERLLRLKKSFMDDLFDTAKERVFK
jgi:hypothetical protein